MKAIIERADLAPSIRYAGLVLRYVASPHLFSGDDAEEFGPVALTNVSNAYMFASYEEAGRWIDSLPPEVQEGMSFAVRRG